MALRKSASSSTAGAALGRETGGGADGGEGFCEPRRLRSPWKGEFSGVPPLLPFEASLPTRVPRRGMAAVYHRAPTRRY
jgi:hypothetical protein